MFIEAARIDTGGTRLVSINNLYKETGWETLQARWEHHRKKIFKENGKRSCSSFP
jgi:hypothetical protein